MNPQTMGLGVEHSDSVYDIVRAAVADVLATTPDELAAHGDNSDLGFHDPPVDSLALVRVLTALEQRAEVAFTEDDIRTAAPVTVSHLADLVRRLRQRPSAEDPGSQTGSEQ